MAKAREVFEASEDFTVGLEEEFGILDPTTQALAQRFGELRDAAQDDEVLADSVAGELIESEIEIRSGQGQTFADAVQLQRGAPVRACSRLAAEPRRPAVGHRHPSVEPLAGAADHRHRALPAPRGGPELRRVAQQHLLACTCTSGSRGADRAIAVCDRLRPILPELLAISANSPFLDGRDSGLHSARSADLHQELPALRDPRRVRQLAGLRRLRGPAGADGLDRRAHAAVVERAPAPRLRHRRGADLRRPVLGGEESTALAGLITACVAQAALDYDEGVAFDDPPAALGRGELLARDPLRPGRHA